MTEVRTDIDRQPATAALNRESDLERILDAWHTATDRLQRTHEVLREEVQRLTAELEVKNRELARKNRLADLGQMASHVAHEVRNGLAPVTLYMSLLRRRLRGDSTARDMMDKIDAAATALETTVSDLLNFTADRDPRRTRFSARELVAHTCESLQPQLTAQRIQLRIDAPSDPAIHADRDMLRRAILNLVLNAIDAMPRGGELSVTASQLEGGTSITVADTGEGIGQQTYEQLCEPFFTTKNEGTGLGLAIVQRIAEAHGGTIAVGNSAAGGATFTISIPGQETEAAA